MAVPLLVYAIGALVASYAIAAYITPKTEDAKRGTLDDFDYPQIDEGTPQAVIFGDVVTEDFHVLYYGNLRTSPVKAESVSK